MPFDPYTTGVNLFAISRCSQMAEAVFFGGLMVAYLHYVVCYVVLIASLAFSTYLGCLRASVKQWE